MSYSKRPTISERQNIVLLSKVPATKLNNIHDLVIRHAQKGRGRINISAITKAVMDILGPLGAEFGPLIIEKIVMPILQGRTPAIFKRKRPFIATKGGKAPIAMGTGALKLPGQGALGLPGQGRRKRRKRKTKRKRKRKGRGALAPAGGGFGTSVGAAKNPLLTKSGARKNPWVQHLKRTHARLKTSGKTFKQINKIAKDTYKKK
jgi:hypothetical protein